MEYIEILKNEVILNPIIKGLNSTHIKIISASISGSLKLISHKTLDVEKLSSIIEVFRKIIDSNYFISLDSPILLKILQIMVVLLSPDRYTIHDDDLNSALYICFKLLSSKQTSVHHASEASLRQVFTMLLDKTYQLHQLIESKEKNSNINYEKIENELNKYTIECSKLIKDICNLTLDKKTEWIKIDHLDRTFCFELLEEVLENHRQLCKDIPEFFTLLKNDVVPLIIKVFELRREFPYMVRLIRISISLIEHFHVQYSMTCISLIDSISSMLDPTLPFWMQVLALDAIKWLSSGGRFLMSILRNDIINDKPLIIDAYIKLITKLGRYISKVMHGWENKEFTHVPSHTHLIETLSTTDIASNLTQSQAISMAIQCLVGIIDTISTVIQDFEDKNDKTNEPSFIVCSKIVDSLWPSILASLSTILSKSKDDDMIQIVLKAYQSFTKVCGVLEHYGIRDTFLTSISKFASPLAGNTTAIDDCKNLSLTKKNLASMKTILNITHSIGSSLGKSWEIVIEPLHQLYIIITTLKKNLIKDEENIPYSKEEMEKMKDMPSREEYDIISSALDSLFSTSQYLTDQGLMDFTVTLKEVFVRRLEKFTPSAIVKPYHTFGYDKMIQIGRSNLNRLGIIWSLFHEIIIEGSNHANKSVRDVIVQRAYSLIEDSINILLKEPDIDKTSPQYVSFLILQSKVLETIEVMMESKYEDIKINTLEATYKILQTCGQALSTGWPIILSILLNVGVSNNFTLIPIGFQSVRIITNEYLRLLPFDCIAVMISTIGSFGGKSIADININLKAIGLLWNIADFIAKIKNSHDETDEINFDEVNLNYIDSLWLALFQELYSRIDNDRFEIRDCTLQTLYGILSSYGHMLNSSLWECVMERFLVPTFSWSEKSLKEAEESKSNDTQENKPNYSPTGLFSHPDPLKPWYNTQNIIVTNFTRVFKHFFPVVSNLPNFKNISKRILEHIEYLSDSKSIDVCTTAINSLKDILLKSYEFKDKIDDSIILSLNQYSWKVWQRISYQLHERKVSHRVISCFVDNIDSLFKYFSNVDTLVVSELTNNDDVEINFDGKTVINASTIDIERLLNVLTPMLLVPLEYVSEFTVLRKQAMPIILSIANSEDHIANIPQIVSMLLLFLSKAIGYNYNSICYVPSEEILDQLEASYVEKKSSRSFEINKSTLNRNLFNIAERSLKALNSIWKRINMLECKDQMKKLLYPDIATVLGISILLKNIDISSVLWNLSLSLFITTSRDSLHLFDSEQKNTIETNLLWTSVIDSVESFLLSNANEEIHSNNPYYNVLLNAEKDVLSFVHELLINCPSLPNLHDRLFQILIDGSEQINREDFMRECYSILFKIISITDESGNAFNVAKKALPLVMEKSKNIIRKFISDDKLSGSLPLPSSRVVEVTFILQNFLTMRIQNSLWEEEAKFDFLKQSNKRHLWEIFILLCDCITTKDPDFKHLLQEILKECAYELGLN